VFVLEKWHQYTFGHQVPIYLYHKPLESITKKPLERAHCKCLQGMQVWALAYDIEAQYLNGKEMFLTDSLNQVSMHLDILVILIFTSSTNLPTMTQLCNSWSKPSKKAGEIGSFPTCYSILPHPWLTGRHRWLSFPRRKVLHPKVDVACRSKATSTQDTKWINPCLWWAQEHVFWLGMNKGVKKWIQSYGKCREFHHTPQGTTHEPAAPKEGIGEDWNWSVFLPWKGVPCYCVLQIWLLGAKSSQQQSSRK